MSDETLARDAIDRAKAYMRGIALTIRPQDFGEVIEQLAERLELSGEWIPTEELAELRAPMNELQQASELASRTAWSFDQALASIQNVLGTHRELALLRAERKALIKALGVEAHMTHSEFCAFECINSECVDKTITAALKAATDSLDNQLAKGDTA